MWAVLPWHIAGTGMPGSIVIRWDMQTNARGNIPRLSCASAPVAMTKIAGADGGMLLDRMREQMGRGPQLADTGLAYSQLLTQDRSPAASSVCSLLQQLHAHRQGPFLQLCTCTTDVSPSPGHWQSAGAKHLDQYQDYSAGSAGALTIKPPIR